MEEFELEPGEHVILATRQHWFVLLLRLLPFVILAVLPVFLLPFFGVTEAVRFFLGIWWLFLWMAVFQLITKYFLTIWVITSHRIVDIEQIGFFRRKVSSFLLLRVQDVTTDVHGIFATLIGFGNLNVETAGSHEKFSMRGIRAPEYVRDLIMGEVAKLHREDDDSRSGI